MDMTTEEETGRSIP